MPRPLIQLSRDEAEMLVDLCEATHDKRLWWLAEDLREQWGMCAQEDPPKKPDLAYLGIKNN
jgi:hypothetical protein